MIIAVTGMRRVGKSVLLRQLRDELADSGQAVYIDKESLDYDEIENARDLVRWVEQRTGSGRYVRRLEYRINISVNSALLILPQAVSIMIG